MIRSLQPTAIALGLALGLAIGHGLGMMALPVVLPAMMADLGWTHWHAGVLAAGGAVGYASGVVLTLTAYRYLPAARTFQLAMVVAAVALVATGAARDIAHLVFLRFVSGLAAATLVISGTLLARSTYVYEPEQSAKAVGIFEAGTGAGFIIGGTLLPLMLQTLGAKGWPEMWLTLGLMALASLPFVFWACRRVAVPQQPTLPATWPWPRYLPALAAHALYAAGSMAIFTFLILRAMEVGTTAFAVIAIWTTAGLSGLLAPAFWRPLLSNLPPARRLAATIGLTASGAVVVLLQGPPATLVIAAALLGFGAFMVPATVEQLVQETLPRDVAATAHSGFLMVHGFSQAIGPLAAGWVSYSTGSLQMGLAIATGALCAGALGALLQAAFLPRPTAAPAKPMRRT